MEKIISGEYEQQGRNDELIATMLNLGKPDEIAKPEITFSKSTDIFRKRLLDSISPNLTASEALGVIIKSALEVEYGTNFTLSRGFDRMIRKLSDSCMTNPELRRQALAVVSSILEEKTLAGKKN